MVPETDVDEFVKFEPKSEEGNIQLQYQDSVDQSSESSPDELVPMHDEITDGAHTFSLKCRTILIGQYKVGGREVVMSEKGIQITAPSVKTSENSVVLNIRKRQIVKILYNINKAFSVLFMYTMPSCAAYVRESLEMSCLFFPSLDPVSYDFTKTKITLLLDRTPESVLSRMNMAFAKTKEKLEEIKTKIAENMLKRLRLAIKDLDLASGGNY